MDIATEDADPVIESSAIRSPETTVETSRGNSTAEEVVECLGRVGGRFVKGFCAALEWRKCASQGFPTVILDYAMLGPEPQP